MPHYDQSHTPAKDQGGFLTSRAGLALLGFLAIAGVLLLTEHRAHVLGASLWLLILACPLIHLFMHRGHGSDHDPGASQKSGTQQH